MTRADAWPWLDRKGRFSWFKTIALILACLPALWLLARWLGPGLGTRPITAAIHSTGLWAVRFLLITLAITPARFVLNWPRIVQLRRMAGLTALAYAVLHLVLYAADQSWRVPHIAAEILHRPYLSIGFTALLGLAVLGLTSTDGWIRHMGRSWKTLHRAVFLFVALAVLHFFMQSKADVAQATLMAGLLTWLLLWRLLPGAYRAHLAGLALLLLAAPIATMAVEYGWYAIATKVPAWRILAANWTPRFWPRPAMWVAGSALIALLCGAGRRYIRA